MDGETAKSKKKYFRIQQYSMFCNQNQPSLAVILLLLNESISFTIIYVLDHMTHRNQSL